MDPQQEAGWQQEQEERARRDMPEHEPLPPPYVTYALLAVMTLVYLAMVWLGHSGFMETSPEMRTLFGDKDNALIHAGQWWRFVTPIFLHGGLVHIAVNGYSLYRLGAQMEQFYGSRRYLILFVTAGVAGNVASFLHAPVHSVGASGALFGLIGAGLVFPLRYRALIPAEDRKRILAQLAQVAVLNLLIGFSLSDIIDNAAHIGGMLGGGFAALFLLPDALMSRPLHPLANAALWVGAVLAVGLLIVSGVRQGMWAMRQAVPHTLAIRMQPSYPPDATVPWWSVHIPQGWKQIGSASPFYGAWRSAPQHARTVEIVDSLHDPYLLPQAQQWAQQPNQAVRAAFIDSKPGRVFTLHFPERTADIYLIEAYGRLMAIKFEADTKDYAAAQPSFLAILAGFRFLHPPTAEEDLAHPVPIAP